MICGRAAAFLSGPRASSRACGLLDLRQVLQHLLPLTPSRRRSALRPSAASSRDPASNWAARCPGTPKCIPCTACNSPGCKAASRGARRISMRCRRCPPQSRPARRVASRAGCTPGRAELCIERRQLRERRRAAWPAGLAWRRGTPDPHAPSCPRSVNTGNSAGPAQARTIRRAQLAHSDLPHPLKALRHHFHVRAARPRRPAVRTSSRIACGRRRGTVPG